MGPPLPFSGPLFGMKRNFNGIGVCLDVYDNDSRRNNPSIFVIQNDGKTKEFGHEQDYENDMIKSIPGDAGKAGAFKCVADIRNTGKPVRLLLKYLQKVLHIYIDNSEGAGWKFCLAVQIDKSLRNHHLALTAATGQVADAHDISDITTRYLAKDDVLSKDDAVWGYVGDSNRSHHTLATLYWLAVCAAQAAMIGIVAYQLQTYYSLNRARIDLVEICAVLNPFQLPHYALHAIVTVSFLLTLNWIPLVLNLPLLAWRGLDFVKRRYLLTAALLSATKGHAKASISVTQRFGGIAAFYVAMMFYYLYRLAF